jgi:hypothetical protein
MFPAIGHPDQVAFDTQSHPKSTTKPLTTPAAMTGIYPGLGVKCWVFCWVDCFRHKKRGYGISRNPLILFW